MEGHDGAWRLHYELAIIGGPWSIDWVCATVCRVRIAMLSLASANPVKTPRKDSYWLSQNVCALVAAHFCGCFRSSFGFAQRAPRELKELFKVG